MINNHIEKSSIDNNANGNEQTLKSSKLLFFQKQERALEIINELFLFRTMPS